MKNKGSPGYCCLLPDNGTMKDETDNKLTEEQRKELTQKLATIKAELDELNELRKEELSWREGAFVDQQILRKTVESYELEIKELNRQARTMFEEKDLVINTLIEEKERLSKVSKMREMKLSEELDEICKKVDALTSQFTFSKTQELGMETLAKRGSRMEIEPSSPTNLHIH